MPLVPLMHRIHEKNGSSHSQGEKASEHVWTMAQSVFEKRPPTVAGAAICAHAARLTKATRLLNAEPQERAWPHARLSESRSGAMVFFFVDRSPFPVRPGENKSGPRVLWCQNYSRFKAVGRTRVTTLR